MLKNIYSDMDIHTCQFLPFQDCSSKEVWVEVAG
jgi:hypothetical protein